jgi:hypothetical protein
MLHHTLPSMSVRTPSVKPGAKFSANTLSLVTLPVVCTGNLNAGVAVMKSAQDGA